MVCLATQGRTLLYFTIRKARGTGYNRDIPSIN